MTSPSKQFRILIFGALLLGALFFFFHHQSEKDSSPAKPVATFTPQPPVTVKSSVPTASGIPAKNQQAVQKQEELTKDLSAAEKKQWQIFTEVLLSKNDNDPRLDHELRHLSPTLKKALETQYSLLPDEKRNERGLVVFLVSRDLSSVEDLQFLESVYQESPCLSLANCGVRGDNDPHFSGLNETSLLYPQVVGLYQLEQQLKARPELLKDPRFRQQTEEVLRSAERFPVPAIQDRARGLKDKYGL
jgi:hypothetical protein